VEFFLMAGDNRLESVSYDVDGCSNTNACANTVVRMALGKTLEEAWNITPDDVVAFLKTLPPHETHCAELSVGAFYLALKDLDSRSRNGRTR
jgi:nitrogen fixation NifU-like protein